MFLLILFDVCSNPTFSVMLLQCLSEIQRGFAQQSVCFQGVVTPYFEVHLRVWCYSPTKEIKKRSREHRENTSRMTGAFS